MSKLRNVSGGKVIRTLCNKMFVISGRTGGHVKLSKVTPDRKVGTVVPMHKELKIGTLKGILKMSGIEQGLIYGQSFFALNLGAMRLQTMCEQVRIQR